MSELCRIPGLFLTSLCHVVVVYYLSEHKYSLKKYIYLSCIFTACFIGLGCCGWARQGWAKVMLYIVIVICLLLFSCIVSEDCFSKKCFLVITYFCLFHLIHNCMSVIVSLLLPQFSAVAGDYAVIVLRNAAIWLFLVLYLKYVASVIHSLSDYDSRSWWGLTVTTVLFYLIQAALSIANIMIAISPLLFLVLLAIVGFTMCAVYGVIFSNISYMKKDAEAALIRQNAEYLFTRLSALQNAEETYRRLRHDMRHHLETIAEYAKAGDTSAVLAYIREYSIEVSETAVKQYSENSTVNSILSVYAGKAAENDIDFSVRCNAPAELTVRDIDLIALLGNLLENALHGCQKSGKEKSCIEIHIHVQSGRLIIVCDNTCADALKLSGGMPAGKSIGISSIHNVCQKYDGNLDYKVEKGICSACAVLNL